MNSEPLISIIMPCYNSQKTIAKSIESVQNQTYNLWELIIADDASTDQSLLVINEYIKNDSRIKVISNCINQGVSYMRNMAMELVGGDYICFLDADDLWPSFKLQLQIDYMLNNQSIVSIGYFKDVDDNNLDQGYIRKCPHNLTYKYLLRNNCVLFQTMMIKSDIKHLLLFKPYRHEDYILALELLKKNITFDVIDEVLAYRRRNQQSLTSNKTKSALWRFAVYRNVLKLNIILSLWYFSLYGLYSIYFRLDYLLKKWRK